MMMKPTELKKSTKDKPFRLQNHVNATNLPTY
jgi:hypothetical protein